MRIDNTAFHFAGHEQIVTENKLFKEAVPKLAEQPVSVSISKEGYESYRNSVQENGQSLTYDQMIEQREMLADVKMDSDMSLGYRLSMEANQLNESDREANGGLSWQTRAENYAKAYANLYDEIVQGYADGTRKIAVSDENSGSGYRYLTMEEELSALDDAYEKTTKDFEELAKQQQKAQTIIADELGKIGKISKEANSKSAKAFLDEYKCGQNTIPDNLAGKILSVRDSWKAAYVASGKDEAWKNIISMFSNIFK